jgi:release factor glutamine methyltransferase
MAGNLTIGALLARGTQRLGEVATFSSSPHLDAELLLVHCLGLTRAQIKSHPESVATPGAAQRYDELIEHRVTGEPLAYITGRKDFWTFQLAVTPAVLVPRPETELLVERALVLRPEPVGRIADLGTGSGAIALALASERPRWLVTATDISPEAIHVARANAALLGLKHIEFLAGSWLEPLGGRRFDLLLSNPPYIAAADTALLQSELKREPQVALTPGADGMAALSAIIVSAPQHLERRGWLLLEHGTDQAAAVARELVGRGFTHVRCHRDLAGHERMTEAQWA